MTGWADPQDPVLSAVTALAGELADPIRLTTLQLLAAEGPHTMSQLAGALGVTAPRLGNHLARLRAAGLVAVEHTGRHAVYRVATPGLAPVLAALSHYAQAAQPSAAGVRPGLPWRTPPAVDVAHTCYDHAAGRLGVTLFAMLVARGAVVPPDGHGDELTLGADGGAFRDLGVDVDAVDPQRRKLATACLDRAYRLPHLGGALGAALLNALVERGLVRPDGDGRLLTVTPRGHRELPALLPSFVPS